MNIVLKIGVLALVSAVGLLNSHPVLAQSLETRQEISKYSTDYIPEFKSSIASQSGNQNLGKIAVNMDFQSFGDNKTELADAARQLFHFKGALLFLNKNATARAAIESKIKAVKIVLVTDVKSRKLTFNDGTLTIASNSFSLNGIHGSESIKTFLLKNL